jgi:hypothetical protein
MTFHHRDQDVSYVDELYQSICLFDNYAIAKIALHFLFQMNSFQQNLPHIPQFLQEKI